MSDLITHLGAGYLLSRALKLKDPRPMLLGSVLPDVSTILWKIPGFLGLYHPLMFPYLESMATPFLLVFMAGAIALLCRKPWHVFAQIYAACLLHVVFDLTPLGHGGQLLLYPYSLHEYSLGLYWIDSPFAWAVMLGFGAVLLLALPNIPRTGLLVVPGRGRVAAVVACTAMVLVVPAFTVREYVAENVCNLRFYEHPENWQGQEVALMLDLSRHGDPHVFAGFRLDTDEPLSRGETVYVRGLHRDRVIHPLEIRHIDKRVKEYGSMAAWAAFVLFSVGFRFPGSPPSGPTGNLPAVWGRAKVWASQARKTIDRRFSCRNPWVPVLV